MNALSYRKRYVCQCIRLAVAVRCSLTRPKRPFDRKTDKSEIEVMRLQQLLQTTHPIQ